MSAEHRAHSRHELTERKRFHHIVVSTTVESCDNVVLSVEDRTEHHRDVAGHTVVLHAVKEFESVDFTGELYFGDNEVEGFERKCECFFCLRNRHNTVAFAPKVCLEERRNVFVVINEQDCWCCLWF